jgi:hypothetical protein
MLNKERLRKKVLLGYLSSLDTIVPALFGVTILLGSLFFGIKSAVAVFMALTSMLWAGGMFLTRLILGSKKIEQTAIEEMQKEVRESREAALDDLERRLTGDGDPRTERLLKDLRVLMEVFRQGRSWSTQMNARSSIDILMKVDDLFKGCERSLEKSLELWNTAQRVSTESARKPILERREAMIEDIGMSLEHLSQVLTEIQGYGSTGEDKESELARIRKEMDQCLEVADRVEERMRRWEGEVLERES